MYTIGVEAADVHNFCRGCGCTQLYAVDAVDVEN